MMNLSPQSFSVALMTCAALLGCTTTIGQIVVPSVPGATAVSGATQPLAPGNPSAFTESTAVSRACGVEPRVLAWIV